MSDDARTVFEAYKTTTLTFDCYGTLIDWESGACRALRDIYGYSRSEVTDDALIDLFLHADARIIRENIFPYSKVLQRAAQSVAASLRVGSEYPSGEDRGVPRFAGLRRSMWMEQS